MVLGKYTTNISRAIVNLEPKIRTTEKFFQDCLEFLVEYGRSCAHDKLKAYFLEAAKKFASDLRIVGG